MHRAALLKLLIVYYISNTHRKKVVVNKSRDGYTQSNVYKGYHFRMTINSRFYVSLNASGLGDQIMAARVATWIGEHAGLVFGGLVSIDNQAYESRSSYSGQVDGRELLGRLKLDGLIVKHPGDIDAFKVGYPNSVDELLAETKRRARNMTSQRCLAIHLDGAQADHFYRNFVDQKSIDIFETGFDVAWREEGTNIVNENLGQIDLSEERILVHLRLGDIANIKLPGDQILIPNHFIHFGASAGIKNALEKNFERYDKSSETFACIRMLQKLGLNVSFHSDGFSYTRSLLRDYESRFAEVFDLRFIQREIDMRERELLDHVAELPNYIGESAENLAAFIEDIGNCTTIITTTGHFAFNIATIFAQRRVDILMEKFTRTSIKHPLINPYYWSHDFDHDISAFVKRFYNISG